MLMSDNEWKIAIGQIVSPFGRKGEAKIRPYTDSTGQFKDLKEAFVIGRDIDGRVLKIDKVWFHKGAVIIKFQGIDDINTVETLRNAEIRIKEASLIPLAADEYYVDDLIGVDVVTTTGEQLGKIKEVLEAPANDVYITDRAMIPAVKEFVLSIDLDKKKMVVKQVEGLVQE